MSKEDLQAIWLTFWTASLAVVLILPFGILLAWLLARKQWLGKSLIETIVALPLVLPPVATGLILLKLLGRQGWLFEWSGGGIRPEVVFTWKAVVIALAVMAFPMLVRGLRQAFEQVPERLELMARTLGKGPWQVFWSVTLPLAKRGLAAALVMAFARAVGEFGATMMIAGMMDGETTTMAVSIYQHVQLGDEVAAMRLMWVSFGFAFLAIVLSEWLNRKEARG